MGCLLHQPHPKCRRYSPQSPRRPLLIRKHQAPRPGRCASWAPFPPEVWNRLGTKILPKLRSGSELTIGLEFTVTVKADTAGGLATELRQILQELGLAEVLRIE